MADSVADVVVEAAKVAAENLTNGTNTTAAEKFRATPEGLILAYSSLVIMALIPIIVGSFRSVHHQMHQKTSGEEIETMSTKEAMMFPLVASCTLFGIYIVFKVSVLVDFIIGVIKLIRSMILFFFLLDIFKRVHQHAFGSLLFCIGCGCPHSYAQVRYF